MHVTEAIGRWLARTGFEDLPQDAVQRAKEVVLDTLGVALAGATQPVGEIVIDYGREAGGRPEATVIGGGFKTDAASAAFANGVLANALDYDATLLPLGHPACTTLPAALAAGEKLRVSGRRLIEAVVLGLEVHAKIAYGYGLQEGPARGSSVGVYGALGAAAASSKLLGLDAWQARMALGTAAAHASGLKKGAGTMTKPYHAGNAASGGVRAAILAKAGWTAAPESIEGAFGYADQFMGLDNYDPAVTIDGLGNPFNIATPGVAIKVYPTCHRNVRSVDAVLKLVEDHDIKPDDVEEIEVRIPHAGWMNEPEPDSGLMAKVSLQYNVAESVLRRSVEIESFDDARVRSPEARAMMKRVKLVVDPSIPSQYNDAYNPVTILLRDGRRLTKRVDVARGEWGDPLTLDEIVRKFEANALRLLPREACDRIVELVLSLETSHSLEEVMALTCAVERAGRLAQGKGA